MALELHHGPSASFRRCSDDSISSCLVKKDKYSSISMVGDKCLYRSRPYYWRKCKRVRGTNIDSLPDELLLDILARLSDDPDYLFNKARPVCRRWCHLIRSRDFIKTQLHRSTYGLHFSLLDHATIMTATQGRIETSEIPYGADLISRSSCNGLVLLQRRGSDPHPMHVVNPATRQQLILPSFSCEGYVKTLHMGCGIGYAADSMVYKVVVPYVTVKGQVVFGILSVGIDKSWRRVGVEHLSINVGHLLSQTVACTTEGFITWSKYRLAGMYLTLDVETEILTLHPGPLPKDYLYGKWTFYLSTGRSLSLLVFDIRMGREYVVEFWEMKEESGKWRKVTGDIKLGAHADWLRQFSVDGVFLNPLGWVRFPEVLALYIRPLIGVWATNYFVFFNLNTQEISSMELPREDGLYYAQPHKKSLSWIA